MNIRNCVLAGLCLVFSACSNIPLPGGGNANLEPAWHDFSSAVNSRANPDAEQVLLLRRSPDEE